MKCTIYNLADCIVAKTQEFILEIINTPIRPLVSAVKQLLTQAPNAEVFGTLWALIVYILSIFYGIFIIFAGLNFIISSTNPQKREMSKEWLKNVILLMICVQASYYIYNSIAQISSGLAQGIFNLIDQNFFLLTIDNPYNFGLQIFLGIVYILVLLLTIIVLAIIYFLSSTGILFFPFGLFFYFIPPLRSIGKSIITFIIGTLFLPFFFGLILVATSKLVMLPNFSNIKILLVISAFILADALLCIVVFLSIMRGITGLLNPVTMPLTTIKNNLINPKQQFAPQRNEREYWGKFRRDYAGYERGFR